MVPGEYCCCRILARCDRSYSLDTACESYSQMPRLLCAVKLQNHSEFERLNYRLGSLHYSPSNLAAFLASAGSSFLVCCHALFTSPATTSRCLAATRGCFKPLVNPLTCLDRREIQRSTRWNPLVIRLISYLRIVISLTGGYPSS